MDVSRETRLIALKARIIAENDRQNLISKTTTGDFENRHLADCAQLCDLLPSGHVVDVGSGGGLPGLVIAILRDDPISLIEPRRRRADFLAETAEVLSLSNVSVHMCRVERFRSAPVAAITARAVASLTDLLAWTVHLADDATRWVLPKGRSARDELAIARGTWQGDFMLVQSRTEPSASIVVADHVRRRP